MKAEATIAKKSEPKPASTSAPSRKLPPKETLVHCYREMLRIRRFEESAFQAYQRGQIGGFCHLYIGQEAVCIGAISVSEKGDQFLTGYRDHAHALALGMTMNELMAELFAKAPGCTKGKGGSMHFFDKELGMMGGNGIVGSHVAVATGVAFAQKYRNEKKVTVVFYGDGAAQQGAVHEAMNLAGLYRLPVIFVIENNLYGMGTAVERSSATKHLYKRAEGYNFPGVECNGMDVLETRECFAKAMKEARENNTPCLIEVKTYRYRGHSMSDPALYRKQEEVEKYKETDPILMLKAVLLKEGVAEADLEKIDEEAKAEAKASIEFSDAAPYPELKELATDVHVQPWDDNPNLLPRVVVE